MTDRERAPAYELPAHAWLEHGEPHNLIRILRHDAQYVPAVERERVRKRGKGRGMAVRSLADVERETREQGGPKLSETERKRYVQAALNRFNPSQHITDAEGRPRVSHDGGSDVQRQKFRAAVLARFAADPTLMRQRDVEIVSLEFVRDYDTTLFAARCRRMWPEGECGRAMRVPAGPASRRARSMPKSCVHCARRANKDPVARRERWVEQ